MPPENPAAAVRPIPGADTMPDKDTNLYWIRRSISGGVGSVMVLYPVAVIRGDAWWFSILLPMVALGQWWIAFDDIRRLRYRGDERAMASASSAGVDK